MLYDFIYEEMEAVEADGVDFVPLICVEPVNIFATYTKEQWKEIKLYPRTGRRYWKFDNNGNKIYIKE